MQENQETFCPHGSSAFPFLCRLLCTQLWQNVISRVGWVGCQSKKSNGSVQILQKTRIWSAEGHKEHSPSMLSLSLLFLRLLVPQTWHFLTRAKIADGGLQQCKVHQSLTSHRQNSGTACSYFVASQILSLPLFSSALSSSDLHVCLSPAVSSFLSSACSLWIQQH